MVDWFFYDVTHARHRYMNPVSEETVEELGEVLDLGPGSRVLDVACGMGEMLLLFHERYGATGVGVDASPYTITRAAHRKADRAPDADIALLHVRGEDFVPEDGQRFDVAMCVGASWIWDGYSGTLDALTGLAKPGGLVVSAEPFWFGEPDPRYLEGQDFQKDMFHTLYRCREIAREKGLDLVWMRESSVQDWDRYEMLQTVAFDRFAREHPGHERLEEIRDRLTKDKDDYLRWGRSCFGFAFWVFRTPRM